MKLYTGKEHWRQHKVGGKLDVKTTGIVSVVGIIGLTGIGILDVSEGWIGNIGE